MLFVIEKNHYCILACHIFMFECVLHTVKTNHLRLLVFLNTGVQSSIYRSDSRASSREQALKKVRSLVYFWAYHVWTLRRNCKSNKKMLYFHVKLIFFWFCRMKVEKTKAFLSSSNDVRILKQMGPEVGEMSWLCFYRDIGRYKLYELKQKHTTK